MIKQVNFSKHLRYPKGYYPSWRQTVFIILIMTCCFSYFLYFNKITFNHEKNLIHDLTIQNKKIKSQLQLYFFSRKNKVIAISKIDSKKIKFSNQVRLISSYLEPGIWLESIMIDANFNFLKLQGVSLSSGKVSRFYSRLESSEGIIGIPLKVIRLGNDIFLDLTRVRIKNEKSLKMSDARLRRDVLQSKNSLPQAEKRLVRIPFLIQTREISGRMAGLIKRSKIINKKG